MRQKTAVRLAITLFLTYSCFLNCVSMVCIQTHMPTYTLTVQVQEKELLETDMWIV